MVIKFNEKEKQFHLFNSKISYVIGICLDGEIGQLYFGKRIFKQTQFVKNNVQYHKNYNGTISRKQTFLTDFINQRSRNHGGKGKKHYIILAKQRDPENSLQ